MSMSGRGERNLLTANQPQRMHSLTLVCNQPDPSIGYSGWI